MAWVKEVLDLIADMKIAADKQRCDQLNQLAADIISQDCRPMVMADNLEYWLKLTDRLCRPMDLGDMDALLEETKGWPETERIAHIKAYMAKVYASIHAQNSAAEAAAHEAKFCRPGPISSGPDFTQEQIEYLHRCGVD